MTIMKCFRMTAAEGGWCRGVGSILAHVSPPPPQPPACSQLGQARQYWKQFQNSFKILSPAGAELGWLLLAGEHNDRSFLTVNFPHFRPELIKYLVSPHGFMNITVWQVNISNYENIPPSFSWWNWFLKTRHKRFMNISIKTTWMKKNEVGFWRNEKK